MSHYQARPGFVLILCVALLLSLAACHVRLVSDYDDQLVKAATTVQTDADTLLQTQLDPPKGTDTSYEATKPAYNKIAVDLNSLRTCATSHPNNGPTIAQVNTLANTIQDLQSLHMKNKPLSPTFIMQEQDDIRTQVSKIIRTENDKKAGN